MLVSFSFLKYLNSGLLADPFFFFFLPPDSSLANEIIFLFYFTVAEVQLRLNRYGGGFDNGRALPAITENECWTFIVMDLATIKLHGKFVRAPVLYRK